MEVGKVKLYKWKKGDGITLLWMAVGALVGLILGMIGGALGWPSIDEMLCYAFFTIGFLLLLAVYLNGYLDCKNENESARALFYVYF